MTATVILTAFTHSTLGTPNELYSRQYEVYMSLVQNFSESWCPFNHRLDILLVLHMPSSSSSDVLVFYDVDDNPLILFLNIIEFRETFSTLRSHDLKWSNKQQSEIGF